MQVDKTNTLSTSKKMKIVVSASLAVAIFSRTTFSLDALPTIASQHTRMAFDFIKGFQEPSGCEKKTGLEYVVAEMGIKGGFAAQFQLGISEWLVGVAYYNYTVPVLLIGNMSGYSEGPECNYVRGDWTCYFLPMSSCQTNLLETGKRLKYERKEFDESIVPPMFAHKGAAWWWGVVQRYAYRLQPSVGKFVLEEANKMDDGRGFPFGQPLIGMHVRHGDKTVDGFKLIGFNAEMEAVRKSPECLKISSKISARRQLQQILDPAKNNCFSSDKSHDAIRVFIASDDSAVLEEAKKLGHLVDSAGVSQQTAGRGMFVTLNQNQTLSYKASLEVITDIYFLSQCSTLVGIAASQVFRAAVGMSNGSDILVHAIAMDYNQLPRIRKMSHRFGLPLPEQFAQP